MMANESRTKAKFWKTDFGFWIFQNPFDLGKTENRKPNFNLPTSSDLDELGKIFS
jgi:hypothetical protein